jgi:hypothetical protein
MEFIKRFWIYTGSMAGVVALYFGAVPLHLIWVFWVVIALAAFAAGAKMVVPRLVTYATRIKNYPALLRASGESQEANDRLRAELREAEAAVLVRWSEGVDEGRRQILGSLLAIEVTKIPSLTGIDLARDGRLLLLAPWLEGGPRVGARFSLSAASSGSTRGVIEVVDVNKAEGRISFLCVEEHNPAFWKHLLDRAAVNSEPPADVTLAAEIVEIDQLFASSMHIPPDDTGGNPNDPEGGQ